MPVHLWLLGQAGFAILGCLSYWNQFWKAKREPENAEVFNLHRFHHVMIPFSGLAGVIFLAGMVVSQHWASSNSLQFTLTCAVNFVYFGVAIAAQSQRSRSLAMDRNQTSKPYVDPSKANTS
ncbi:MAG TPA: hypothetical protein VJW55_08615, partial [Candidatus Angelobacter sp.]|nr:hypothetical protein [Candidatus Angelobacter sp.]